jgi:hypothetical protein
LDERRLAMTAENRRSDADNDHVQTIKGEPDARGGPAKFKQPIKPPNEPTLRMQASPIPVAAELSQDQEGLRAEAGDETIGDALGSGPGRDIGSGTPPVTGELGGGDAPIISGGAEPLGTARPGDTREPSGTPLSGDVDEQPGFPRFDPD